MVEHIMQEAKESGKDYMVFKVHKNNEAQGFYGKMGMEPYEQKNAEFCYKIKL